MKARVALRAGELAAVDGTEKRVDGACALVRVVLGRVAKNVGQGSFKVRIALGPEHRGRIAHLDALGRILAQQVIQGRGVGKGGGAAHGGVFALALGLAVGLEGAGVERDDVGPRGLRAPHALDGGVQPLHRGHIARHQAHGLRRVVIAGRVQRRLHHGGALAYQFHIAMQAKAQERIGLQHLGPGRVTLQRTGVKALQKPLHGLHACIRLHRSGQSGNACLESGVLLGHALRLALGVHAQHVFQRVPQQVGGHARGLLHPHGHAKRLRHLALALRLARIADLQQFAVKAQVQDEGNLLGFNTEVRQALRRVGVIALAAVVVVERLQNHPRVSEKAGTWIRPDSSLASKKRGWGSVGWLKSRSCSIQPRERDS